MLMHSSEGGEGSALWVLLLFTDGHIFTLIPEYLCYNTARLVIKVVIFLQFKVGESAES